MTEPTISIITPSYNQGAYLEACMRSILDQGYGSLEYVVVDGGSTDGSVETIRRYEDRLAYWVSEPDEGQYHAINKGFAKTSGEIMGWLNSDDMLLPGALSSIGEIFEQLPHVEWISSAYPVGFDERGRAVEVRFVPGFSRDSFLRGANLPGAGWYATAFIQQESTFWRRSLWDRAGGALDTTFPLAADFELWARFFQHAELYAVRAMLGGFRKHGAQKTAGEQLDDYVAEARRVLAGAGGRPPGRVSSAIRRRAAAWIPDTRRGVAGVLGLSHPGLLIEQDRTGDWVIAKTVLI